ncbi:MAG TPA: ROK family transcriptional regulator [Luteimicrobium sp.]|nr:ROK family transcriptional regulator [Luteimicrobium sp.]
MNTKRATPGSQASLRESNRARLVEAVKHHGGLTQVELAGATGLSPASVSNIVKELVAAGVLATSTTTRSGRRAQYVTLARTVGLVAGVHFGTRHLHVAVADATGLVLADQRMPLAADHRADAGLDRLALLLADMVDSLDASLEELLAVGLGIPAPFDSETGQVTSPGMLRGWGGVDVAQVMSRRIATPVFVDNDANLGALAELRQGAARGAQNAVYVSVSHRIGAGLVLGGEVYRGAIGTAGEIGHVTIDENGPICRCGNRGCLETFAGAHHLLEMLRGSHGALTLRDVIRLALDDDAGCRRVISDAGRHIGVALANLCNLLNPQRVVIGGELATAGELLLGPVRDAVARCALPSTAEAVEIVPSELGSEAELRGAVALAIDHAAVQVLAQTPLS